MLLYSFALVSAATNIACAACSVKSSAKEQGKEKERNTESPEIEVKDLGKYLVDLDEKILRMLILPEKGGGNKLVENLKCYLKNFRRLDGLVVLHEQSAFRPAKYFLDHECPKFITEAFDVLNLQRTYHWDAVEFATFREYLLFIASLARKFPEDFSKMRVDVETLFEKPLVQEQ